jgi:RNA polymerase subunit RPABC4/transcription elongation factor Spt4
MIQCNNCGQVNAQESNFCRFCGAKSVSMQQNQFNPPNQTPPTAQGTDFEYAPPRPHVWKTDELHVSDNKTRPTEQINRVQPLANFEAVTNQTARTQPLARYQQNNLAYGYRCPRCASQLLPRLERKVSSAGWITFAVLMVAFFPLFWIGLLIKEDVRVCPVCNLKSK